LAHNSYPGGTWESEKRQTFFTGSWQIRNMDNNIPPRKNMRENKSSFLGPQSMGSENKYLSGHSKSAASGGRDCPFLGNELLPLSGSRHRVSINC
jgi:hypothetical protein